MTIIYILAVLSLTVYLLLLAELCRRKRRRKSRRARPKFSRPPMDLRLPEDPCDRCLRWGECNGVDREDGCPLWKEESDVHS